MERIEIDDCRLKEWAQMTEHNQHGKRLERIADYFSCVAQNPVARADFRELRGLFNEINALHDMRGYLSDFLYNIRSAAREGLDGVILKTFGEDVLRQIQIEG